MDDIEKKREDFVGYEYKEIHTESSRASFLIDGYENFGWVLDDNLPGNSDNVQLLQLPHQRKVILRLKRDRKMINKMELIRLQRNFEAYVNEIEKLEESKASVATVYALIIAVLGTAFMACSVFAVTAQPPHILLCILFAIPGFIGWVLPYFIYKKTVEKQTVKITPLIEEKYNEIYEICEKGNRLLH